MRSLVLLLAALTVTVLSTPAEASAQTAVDGNWLLVLNSPVGVFEIPVSVAQEGEQVMATLAVEAPDGQEFSLEGSLQGAAIRWSAEVDYEGMPIVISLSGNVTEGTMSGTADYGGMAQGDWSAERAEG